MVMPTMSVGRPLEAACDSADSATNEKITDEISDENGTPDPRRALQLPSDVISAGLTPNPRN